MQAWNLERIPLPNFSTYVIYTTVSLLGSVLHVFFQMTKDAKPEGTGNSTTLNYPTLALTCCLEDSWCFWSFVNFGYCLLMYAARELQNLFFGQLRSAEDSHIRENFSSFIFYKVVFIYGILHVEVLHELLLWATWFTILGFLRLLTGLIRDRSQYSLRCSDFSLTYQARIFLLCCLLLLFSNVLMIISIIVGAKHSLNTMFFMLAEVFQLLIVTVHVITWYVVYLYCEVASRSNDDDKVYHRFVLLYYTEFVFDTIADAGDVFHNLHMLFWNKLQINMSSIIVALHLQHLYYKVSRRFVHHKRYKNVLKNLDTRIVYSKENCPICWEKMRKSCQLPCGHIFHTACLYLWIEQNNNCPVCRKCFDDLNGLPSNTVATNLPTTPPSSFSTSESSEISRGQSNGSGFHPLSSETSQIGFRCENQLNVRKLCETCIPTTKNSGFSVRQITADSLLSANKFTSSNESYFSAMVSMDRLLDVHDQLIAEDVANVRTRPKNALPAKFLAILEAELLRHFRLSDSSNNSKLKSFRCKQQEGSLTEHTVNSHAHESTLLITDQSPLISSTPDTLFSTLHSSQSSSDSSHTDDEDKEFPPKRALRLAIRRLLQRVNQSLLISGKMCQCHALNVCTHKSGVFERDKLSIQPTSSVDNIICQTPNTSTPFHSYPSTLSSSSTQLMKHYQTSSLVCSDTSCSPDILSHRNRSSLFLDPQTYHSTDEQLRVENECKCNSSSVVHPFESHRKKHQEKCLLSRRGHFKLLTKRPYLKKTK